MSNIYNVPLQNRFVFSGKRIDTLEWIEGFAFQINDNSNPIIMIPNSNGETHEIDMKTLRFSFNYRDDNGKRIFDKDIIEFTRHNDEKERCLIQWIDEGQEFQAIPLVKGDDISDHEYYFVNFTRELSWDSFILMIQNVYGDFKKIEVIGNSIDNPELISVTDTAHVEKRVEENNNEVTGSFYF